MAKPKQPSGPPMTLGNMRALAPNFYTVEHTLP
jgi:hypothetical protein